MIPELKYVSEMAEQFDTKSRVKLGGFDSSLKCPAYLATLKAGIQLNNLSEDDNIYIYI